MVSFYNCSIGGNLMEKIIDILRRINSCVDYSSEKHLISNGAIESIDIVMIIAELEENFNIEIPFEYINKANFESADSILKMVNEIKENT